MAGIITDVSEDIKRLQELKNEIESVKKSLKSIDIQVKLDIKESLEAQLKSLMGQYDSLVQKIGESEGKIMLSIRNINEATEKIINSQEKLSSSAKGMSGVSNIGTTDTSIETDGVKAQAKAYEELKTAIEDASGSVNQNIVLMMRMQETVNSYKKELKELEKGPKTDETVDRMAQITSEIEKGKLAIADYRRAFQSSLKIEFAASGSMNELSQQLGKMRSVYRDLTEEERNSPFGKELLVSIQQADAKIKELDASIGNHQRNVGNYGSVFDSVSGKLNEFASSASAIPGPVGNIASSIQGMTKASLAFIATPLGLVLAAISAALAAVSSWFHRTEKGENALNVATAAFSGTFNTLLDVVDNVGEWLFKCFTKPKEALSDLVDFLKGQLINRLKAVAKGAEAILKIFSGDMSGISDFQNAWIQGLTGIEDAGKKYDAFIKKSVNNANERAKLAERQNVLDRKERENLVEKAKLEQKISELRAKGMDSSVSEKERAKAIKEASKLTNKMYNDEIALAKEKYEIIKKTNSLSHSNKADKEKEAQAEARLYQLESQRNNNQRMLTRQLNRVQNSQIQSKNKVNAINQANEKLDETTRKNAEERMKLEANLEEMVLDARIKAMENGEEKVQAERNRQNEKELKQIEEQRKAAVEAEIKRQKQEFDAKQNVIKEKGGYVAQWDESMIDTTFIEQIDMQYKEIADSISESQKKMRLESDRKAWQEYFIEFGNYQEKRKNLIQKYDDEIAKASSEGEKASLRKHLEKELQDLDLSELKTGMNWEQVFGNLDKVSTDTLKKLKANLKDFISGQKDLSPENLKELVNAIERIDDKVSERNPFEAMSASFKSLKTATDAEREAQEAYNKALKEGTDEEMKNAKATLESAKNNKKKALSEATDALHKGAEKVSQFVDAGNQVIGIMETLGVKTPEWLEGTMSGIGEMLNGLSNIDLTKPMSIVTGGLQTIKGALTSVVSLGGLIPGLGGADYSRYNEMVEEYGKLNDIWDELIDKKLEYIGISYGVEANKVGKEAIELAEKSIESYRILGKERLNSGASAGSHSIGVRQRKGMSKEGWNELQNAAKSIGFDYDSVAKGRMTGLFDLTAEQLDKLKQEAPTFWAKLNGDVREYLDNIIEGEERIQDIQNQVKEQLTQVSFDSVFDSFVDVLMDMDSSAEDFSKNFEQYMQRAILTTMVGDKYKEKLQAWYDSFAKANDDEAGITKEEMDKSQAEWDAIVAEALAERETLKNAMGWTGSSTTQQSATAGVFETMSQDTATELNGRFTALQIAGEEIKAQNIIQSESLNLLTMKADALLSVGSETRNIADDTRSIIANSYLELQEIRENTGAIVKPIIQMQKDIAEVKQNTSRL